MSEQQGSQQCSGSDGKMPSLWNCAPFDGNIACGGGGDDADSIVEEAPPPLRPQQRVRNLVDGILSPFMACVQPNLQACMAPTTDWEPQQTCYPMYSTASSTSRRSSNRGTTGSSAAAAAAAAAPVVLSSAPLTMASSTTACTTPNENDVLCGRGNNSTRHPGNQNFRDLIAANKSIYGTLTKKEKMLLARQIVDLILHNTDPPARFLGRDTTTGLWYDIGMPRSLEKTSQALREKTAAAKASGKLLALKASQAEIKSVLSSDSTLTDKEVLSDVGSGASESVVGSAAEEGTKAATPKTKNRNGPVEAPPLKIPLHLQQVYGFKGGYHPHQGPGRLQQVPPPPGDPYASSQHHHHQAYSPQAFQRNAFRPSSAHLQNPPPPPPPEMNRRHSAKQGNPRHQYPNEGRHPYPPQQQQPPPPAQYAAMLSPPRQGQQAPYPVVTPQPAHYQDQAYERPPPLRSIVSSDSAPVPADEKSSSLPTVSSSSFTRERPSSNGKISPTREQEWKRQRVSDKTKRRLAADADKTDNRLNTSNESSNGSSTGLTNAIETKLTLEDRVVRSPSTTMQSTISGRRRSLEQPPVHSIAKPEQSSLDISADSSMDGLTALSTAAFLRLDESY